VSDKVAWAGGAGGTCLKTTDGGATWQQLKVPGAESLDFRDVDAFDADTAYLLSIGEGEKSRIYKTNDGGRTWQLQFTNRNPKAFFDAMAFWDAKRGVAVSDPVDGHLLIIKTSDGGATWTEVPAANVPAALPNEGAFAASGTCVAVQGRNNAWIVTGGGAARVFRSTDGGNTWQVAATPIISGAQATGIFSVAFKDAKNGVIVGGDYTKESEARDNAAISGDGGHTWTLTKSLPGGFRSGVVYANHGKTTAILAVGPKGTDYTLNNGASWTSLGTAGYHAVGFAGATAWAVGEGGRIGKFVGPFAK
jgi:photosystem II stability/assembly factor-like uncharacterized protein